MGLTPLLCAVKNHSIIEEGQQTMIDSSLVIQTLLKHNADPMIPVCNKLICNVAKIVKLQRQKCYKTKFFFFKYKYNLGCN